MSRLALALAISFVAAACGRALDVNAPPPPPRADAGTMDVRLPPPIDAIIVVDSWCGDGFLDVGRGEVCDDGNRWGGDGCSSSCQLEGTAECPVPGQPCHVAEHCGDGLRATGEDCDDGNRTSGDGCSAGCVVEAGFSCRVPGGPCTGECGNWTLDGRETCDDGNVWDGDGCSSTCQVEAGCACADHRCVCYPCIDGQNEIGAPCVVPRCGDGAIGGDETCDDGALNGTGGTPGCSLFCQVVTYCGNGVVDPGEACDQGPANTTRYGTGCASTCQPPPFCGDGMIDVAYGEQCDLGPNNGPRSQCTSNCNLLVVK